MPPLGKARRFEILSAALALADERGDIALADAAAELGVDYETLRDLVAPVVLLEWRTPHGDIIDELSSFLLNEDDHLVRLEDHWLRALASVPPDPDAAFRLLLVATHVKALVTGTTAPLDSALAKLQGVVGAEVVLPVERPPLLPVADEAFRTRRTLRFRYVKDGHPDATEREVEPHLVFSRWGHWYVMGCPVGEDVVKEFRVDRMVEAELGERTFDPPDDVEVPEWFDLAAHERTVRLRLPRATLDELPSPHRLGPVEDLDGGRVEVEVTVAGARRLEHLLVAIGPEAEVVAPAECGALRRDHARALLARYR